MSSFALALALALGSAAIGQEAAATPAPNGSRPNGRVLARLELFGVEDQTLADSDGDGKQEVIVIDRQPRQPAALLRFALGDGRGGSEIIRTGRIEIPDAEHCLVAVADVLPRSGDEFVLADSRRTVAAFFAEEFGGGGPSGGTSVTLARRARIRIHTGTPKLSPFVLDLNQDGRLDLMLPTMGGVEPYLQVAATPEQAAPTFQRMEIVPVPIRTRIRTGNSTNGNRGLDQELLGTLSVPRITTDDLNGDGRDDLLTREGSVRRFHLQRGDGSFDDPIEVDLEQFVDSTPKAAMELGQTAVISDAQQLQSGDINGDEIPDYVIAHRRKIWTFLASRDGPQFQKARTQAVAEDVSGMLLLDLDEDGKRDLLTIRAQLPGVGSLILGLLQSIDVDVHAVGYRSEVNGFASKPRWRRTVTIRIPPVLSLLSRQDELVERFTSLIGKVRISTRGDFTGDSQDDLAVVGSDGQTLELYRGVPAAPSLDSKQGVAMLRKLVFEDEDPIFDLDRVFGILSGLLDDLGGRITGGRERSATIDMRDPAWWTLDTLQAVELDGAPGQELLLVYRHARDPRHRAFDVLSW
ncbi:MAG: FG-GAP repeat domain-containing protein [Planctomycetota bacterium]